MPTDRPTPNPTTDRPTATPTSRPTTRPTDRPTTGPTDAPTLSPVTDRPTDSPTLKPTRDPPKTFVPGDLTVYQNNLILSTGLSSTVVARSGSRVRYTNGQTSLEAFHDSPDGAACVHHPDGPEYGWIYVSNSEVDDNGGGVGSIFFDASGGIYDFRNVLRGTTFNCGGGLTPWGTWISAEETWDYEPIQGQIYEVDPSGRRPARQTVLGQSFGGTYESFAYDVRDWDQPRFFYTEDRENGAIRRYTPHPVVVQEFANNGNEAFNLLHNSGGTFEYLVFNDVSGSRGTFSWTTSLSEGRDSAENFFPWVEGIDCRNGMVVFISKKAKKLFMLDLDAGTWTKSSTRNGPFDGEPDQVNYMLDYEKRRKLSDPQRPPLLIFTEEDGERAGIHGRDADGNYVTLLESLGDWDETTGLAFSPNRMFMYFAFQDEGLVYAVWRDDGYPFDGNVLDAKYHYVED